MNHSKQFLTFIFVVLLSCANAPLSTAADLVWNGNKTEVFRSATQNRRHILLLVGDSTNANCKEVMHNLSDQVMQRTLNSNYVLWYSYYDDAEKQAEVKAYTEAFDNTEGTAYPFLYIINPEKPDEVVASKWGKQSVEELRLLTSYSLTPKDGLKWYDDQEKAFSLAKEQNKYLFLLVGRSSCGNCKNVISNLNNESKPLKEIIEDNYVLWYSLRDDPAIREEVASYTAKYDQFAESLPFLYIIDPEKPNAIVDSVWGGQTTESLNELLSVYLVANENIESTKIKISHSGSVLRLSNEIENEHISIYTATGQLVYSTYKREREIAFSTFVFPRGILIIRSSKGWSSKIMNR